MEEIINEMDGLFKQVVKYYPMKDLAETKRQWNGLIAELKNCNLQNVIKSVCKHDNMERISENYFQCVECGEIKGFGQTDL